MTVTDVPEETTDESTDGEPSRRGFFKKGAVAAATLATVHVATARSAGAANGSEIVIGTGNSGNATTGLDGSTFSVTDGNTGIALRGEQTAPIGNPPIGVYGEAANSAGGLGVQGKGATYGVYGEATGTSGGVGVYGTAETGVEGDGSGPGSLGVSGSGATGVRGTGTRFGLRGTSANGAQLFLDGGSTSVPPTAGSWTAGSLVNDGGQLWFCVASGTGTDSKWVRLSQGFVPLASPTRIYDSRPTDGPLGKDGERTIDTTSTGLVPASASTIYGNFTVVSTGSAGFGAVFSNAVSWPGHSNINFNAPGDYANSFISATDGAGAMKVRAGGGSPTIQVIFDVFGYWS